MSNSMMSLFGLCLLVCLSSQVFATPQVTVYWGQNSNNKEKELVNYCQDSTFDIIVIAFVIGFPGNPTPTMNLANHCETPYPGYSQLLYCPDVGRNITFCQQRGKKVVISLGGAVGSYGFSSDAQAQTFAGTVWDMFLGGSGNIRPFGAAVLDGVDLDIEGGSPTGYAAFTNAIRAKFVGASKPYYITAAPQCPYPDYFLGPSNGAAFSAGWFDYVWVQFYNNYCGLSSYPTNFNFNTWANWARNISLNKNVQVFIGAPASPQAGSGYVSASTLQNIVNSVESQYGSIFGGVMMWDAGNSDANGNYGAAVASFLKGNGSTSSSGTSNAFSTGISVTSGIRPLTSGAQPPVTSAQPLFTSGTRTSAQNVQTTASLTSAVLTTGNRIMTTGNRIMTTGQAIITTGKAVITTDAPSTTSACTVNSRTCINENEFQTCAPYGLVTQSCPSGTTCLQYGNTIRCQ